ncbi:unnamed protein product [Litomosoides sigmodontis]|uniref:Laminin EGF-like domain-containing protein n=1 Tax=Litomosoides sigmodontis TaxID=42156 RepID=A0A3P6UF83_LITSI|nr:unnamed protein product [Litomosoides sigmodontis]
MVVVNSETTTVTVLDTFSVHNVSMSADVIMEKGNMEDVFAMMVGKAITVMISFVSTVIQNSDINNNSESCVCPARFTGTHCDRCSQKGPKIRTYPECNIDISKSKAKQQRQETETQFRLRLTIMGATSFLLLFLVITMIFFHRRRSYKRQRSDRENLRQREYEVRKTILEQAARNTECLNVEQRTEYIEEDNRSSRNHMKTNRRLSHYL